MNKLEKSYLKQKNLFESRKEEKIQNIEVQINQVEDKIRKLNLHSLKLSEDQEKIKREKFISFEDFKLRSTADRVASNTNDTDYLASLDQETQNLVLNELRRRGFQ